MARIIEARAVINGEEKLSPLLDKLAKKFEQVRKSATSSEGVDKMAAAIGRVGKQMQAVDRFNSSRSGIMGAFNAYREAQRNVEAAARAMRSGQGDARKLATEYERAVSAVQRASTAFERQRSAILANKRALGELGVSSNRIISEQQRLAASVDRANSALDRQRTRGQRIRAGVGGVASNLGFLAGPGILRGTKAAVEGGAHIQSEIVKMRAAGIPESEIQSASEASSALAAKYTNVKRSDIMERYKELRSVLVHPEETPHMLEPTIKANSALNAIDRSGQLSSGLQFAIKAAEVMGLAQDPKRFEHYLDAFIKAQQVMGKTITPEQQFDLATNFKASAATLSDRFKTTTGISLAQEMRGMRAGVGVDQFVKQIVGGFQGSQHAAAKEFVALGLIAKDDVETTKTGSIKGLKPGRHVAGHRLAMSDPDEWVYRYLLPALEMKGITKQEDQLGMVRRLFTSSRSADIVAKLIQQRASFENHAKLYGQAQGLNAIGNNQQDPFTAFNSMTTSLGNLAATLTSPIMESAAGVLSGMASSFGEWGNSLAKWQKANPTTAEVAGAAAIGIGGGYGILKTYGLVTGLFNGFGLKSSAAALDGSAAALMRAAAALGGGSIPEKAVKEGSRLAPWIAGGVSTGIVAAGAGLAYGATSIIANNPTPAAAVANDPFLSALSGDTGIAAAIIEATRNNKPTETKVTGEARVTIDIPGVGSRVVNVPLTNANGPGSLGTSSPDAAPGGLGHR